MTLLCIGHAYRPSLELFYNEIMLNFYFCEGEILVNYF